jgi:hypothetical protein
MKFIKRNGQALFIQSLLFVIGYSFGGMVGIGIAATIILLIQLFC